MHLPWKKQTRARGVERTGPNRPLKLLAAATGPLVAIGSLAVVPPVGAQLASPIEPSSDYTVAESAAVSPLTPGVASNVIYTIGEFDRLAPTDDGFAWVSDDGAVFTVDEIDLDGVVTSSTIDPAGSIDIQYIVTRVTDEHVLLRITEFDIGAEEFVSSTTALLDRATGGVVAPLSAYPGLSEPPQMTDDGAFVATHLTDDRPIVLAIEGGAIVSAVEWDEDGFAIEDPQPHLHPSRPRAAVLGSPAGSASGELWVRSFDGGADRRWELPCSGVSCSYDLRAFTALGAEGTVFYSVTATGPDFDPTVDYRRVDVATGVVSDAVPIVLGSPNGRYGIGPAIDAGGLASNSDLEIHDFVTGRTRTIAIDLGVPYLVEPVSLSNDGTTVRYVASSQCLGRCVALPSYFGSFDLSPVADVTRGPAEDEILRLYRAVFGRIPDQGGFEFWINEYREGRPLLDIAAAFAASPEFAARYGADLSDESLVDLLYRNVLGRPGEPAGVEFWLGRRAGGASIAELLVAFANSPENIDRTGTRNPISVGEGRVLRLYRAMLGREPDAGGLAFWVGRYADGLSLAEMASQFTFQAEFLAIYGEDPSNAELVDAVYRNVLDRPGDGAGVAFWLDRLETGLTVPELFVSFAESPENIEGTGTVR